MEDNKIVTLYWERSEEAIAVTQEKYGKYCYSIAFSILNSEQDSEECVNDTYNNAWNAMPPHRPSRLSTFLGKITRNIALNRYYHNRALKRSSNIEIALDELEEVLAKDNEFDSVAEETVLKDIINRFLASLSKDNRIIFVRRYWYLDSIKDISVRCGISESNVKAKLLRTRNKFKVFLESEGIHI